jgi:hypothetical protein
MNINILGRCRNACITTGSVPNIFCDLGKFYLGFAYSASLTVHVACRIPTHWLEKLPSLVPEVLNDLWEAVKWSRCSAQIHSRSGAAASSLRHVRMKSRKGEHRWKFIQRTVREQHVMSSSGLLHKSTLAHSTTRSQFNIQIVSYCHLSECDNRRDLDWWLDLLTTDTLTARTYMQLQHHR